MACVFLVGMAVYGFKFLDAREVALILARFKPVALPLLVIFPAAFLWLKATRYATLFSVSGDPIEDTLAKRLTKTSYAAAQLATLLPGGYVARIGLMERSLKWGARAVIPTLLEKGLDLGLLGLVGLLTCWLYPETRVWGGLFLGLLVVSVSVFASRTIRNKCREVLTSLATRLAKKSLVTEALRGRRPSRRTMTVIALQTVAVLSLELLILWFSFAALGLYPTLVVVVMGYAVADIVGRVAPTPGGFGVTEVGMVSLIHHLGEVGLNEAAAATFLFRFLLFLLPALYGSLCYLFLWAPLIRAGDTTDKAV